MTTAFKMAVLGAAAAMVLATVPAAAMPVGDPGWPATVETVSGWATRAEGRRHTYGQPYGYYAVPYGDAYGPGVYDDWDQDGDPGSYGGAYGRAVPAPAYGDDDDGTY